MTLAWVFSEALTIKMRCEASFPKLFWVSYALVNRSGSSMLGGMHLNALSDRRSFLARGALLGSMGLLSQVPQAMQLAAQTTSGSHQLNFGLVTYLWGKDMSLPELLKACEASGMLGVETRTQHAHGLEPSLSSQQRQEVRKRFADSPVKLVGYGSNAEFHDADTNRLRQQIDLTKQYIRLMHDCGGSGVKVKPNGFAQGVSKEKTILQIGRALNEVAAYGDDWGQEIRVEAHGRGTSDLSVMKAIFDVADHPNVGICWNSNDVDTQGDGLVANFKLVRDRFAKTLHVRELNEGTYPYAELMGLLLQSNYQGWVLLEARTNPSDKIAAMKAQREVFEAMLEAHRL
jgi:sugar phosphate isomerase/epimerase